VKKTREAHDARQITDIRITTKTLCYIALNGTEVTDRQAADKPVSVIVILRRRDDHLRFQ
jgi:hypothetical protein